MTSTDTSSLDPLACAASHAERPGTVFLHDGRPGGRQALLVGPRCTIERSAEGRTRIRGTLPRDLGLEDLPPAAWPGRLQSRLPDAASEAPWLAGFLGFEAGLPAHGVSLGARARFDLPIAWLGIYDHALVRDGDGPTWISTFDLGPLDPSARRTETAGAEFSGRIGAGRHADVVRDGSTERATFLDRAWHRRAIETIHEHIRRGDVYQINLTGQVTARTTVHPFEGFRREIGQNPTRFAAYVRLEHAAITSHSPELLLEVRGDELATGPIKGTAPIGQETALRASAKDRAEHVMIVDLCRHDLGRIAVPGSVRVDPLMEPLSLRGLTHLVSTVRARCMPGRAGAALQSLFPAGSISGAPKRRALEIIRAVEAEARGPYTGTIGAVCPSGRQDWSIAIRTAVWQDDAVHFGCGGGIVLDSDPDREFEEARLKARSFFESLGAPLEA